MAVVYSHKSPYFTTEKTDGHLDVLNLREIPATPDDSAYTIEPKYANRPDLLAYDLYGSADLWWVFAVRNRSIIKDPVFDMVAGTTIYLPQQYTLRTTLGI